MYTHFVTPTLSLSLFFKEVIFCLLFLGEKIDFEKKKNIFEKKEEKKKKKEKKKSVKKEC